MFTGLIQAVGEVTEISPEEGLTRFAIDPRGWTYLPAKGDSIAVSGVCLTHTADGPEGILTFDAVPETLSMTILGRLRLGSRVNLEHSVRADTLMGGHFVQGHVDGVGEVSGVEQGGEGGWRVRVTPPGELMRYIAPKGSITIDGVSLTIAAVDEGAFEVALIPTTLELTTLADLKAGELVNLETDILARTVVSYMERFGGTP
jgi:riboflavin synthase